MQQHQTPSWMKSVLAAAAVYNLAWGMFVVLMPGALFRFAGLEPPNYPSIVQCLGMVVGVYGIAYGIAAADPVTHWPIIFVGLLGKIFGPIGFVWTAMHGELPWSAGVMLLANDLVWWIPFVAILVHVGNVRDAVRFGTEKIDFATALQASITDRGVSLWAMSQERPTFVLFIRHSGCTFCREALADLKEKSAELRQRGWNLVVVHMSPQAAGRALLDRFGLHEVAAISDPDRSLHEAFKLHTGSLGQLIGPSIIWQAMVGGTVWRHGFGPIIGSPQQLAGAFVVDKGRIVQAYRCQTSADRPNITALPEEVCAI
ncbi:MAG: SelL-related redox protein [Planctomycetaceae bacterium]|nr:SelL-related redox protein [Planctomycetaceae bacterium]